LFLYGRIREKIGGRKMKKFYLMDSDRVIRTESYTYDAKLHHCILRDVPVDGNYVKEVIIPFHNIAMIVEEA